MIPNWRLQPQHSLSCKPLLSTRPTILLPPPRILPRWWGRWWGAIGREWALKRRDGAGVWAAARLVQQQFVAAGRILLLLLLSKPRYWNTPHYWLKPSKWQLGCEGCWSKVNPNIVWGTAFTAWAHMGSDDIYWRRHNSNFLLATILISIHIYTA